MKSVFTISFILLSFLTLNAQDYYWVFFKDKKNTEFDPFSYFDEKAIERRIKNNISLYDISDYPLNSDYTKRVLDFSDEYLGQTRWLNAIAISSSPENIEYIKGFDFVKNVELIYSYSKPASIDNNEEDIENNTIFMDENIKIAPQVKRMKGDEFANAGINGEGIRIAVFDVGFKGVDTHIAFKHLRDNNKILKTWNFHKKSENVYGGGTHGTSVLSCIAGLTHDGKKIGLATESEFLLARTEISTEPHKEEVWWLEALEWADKNGADIINSSLGYASQRYNISDMDGKTSLVTRGANTAASKGILVCNAMGNEGDSYAWRVMGAPADADSILSIGGISSVSYKKSGFSSFGPTADGRMKPNVCAFGNAICAVPNKENNKYSDLSGTSFASPLVAGFAACAWQTRRDLSAIEMKAEIEKSGDHYPYFDYALGYGVPQASYFMNTQSKEAERNFVFEIDKDNIQIKLLGNGTETVFYHIQNENGILDYYAQVEIRPDIYIEKSLLYKNKTLRVFCNGFIDTYQLSEKEIAYLEQKPNDYMPITHNAIYKTVLEEDVANFKISKFGIDSRHYAHVYLSYARPIPLNNNSDFMEVGNSSSFNIGARYKFNFTKWYSWGAGLEFNWTKYRVKDFPIETLKPGFNNRLPSSYTTNYEKLKGRSITMEIYQRIRFVPTGTFGIYLDLGAYGSWAYNNIFVKSVKSNDNKSKYKSNIDSEKYNWGLKGRVGWGAIAIYCQYRMSDYFIDIPDLPKITVGLELSLPI